MRPRPESQSTENRATVLPPLPQAEYIEPTLFSCPGTAGNRGPVFFLIFFEGSDRLLVILLLKACLVLPRQRGVAQRISITDCGLASQPAELPEEVVPVSAPRVG